MTNSIAPKIAAANAVVFSLWLAISFMKWRFEAASRD